MMQCAGRIQPRSSQHKSAACAICQQRPLFRWCYQLSTSVLNKAVSRNIDRFPPDFMFQLTKEEFSNLKFHFGTSSWGGRHKLPRAFTAQGVAMLSTVLKSKRAVIVNIEIMRAFVKLRRMLASHAVLARKLDDLEKKYDKQRESAICDIKRSP